MKIKPLIIIRIIGIFAMLNSPITGGLSLIAGIGIILRQNWARCLGLIVFGIWPFLTITVIILNMFVHKISEFKILISMVIFSLLSTFCFWLLTRKEIVAEFKRK